MVEQEKRIIVKNPAGAALLSCLCPGVGFFYLGNFIKGITYMLLIAGTIVLLVERASIADVIPIEMVGISLMLGGIYFYQIFDSFNEAKRMGEVAIRRPDITKRAPQELPYILGVIALVSGILLQLATLEILSFGAIFNWWPVVLVGLGIKYILMYTSNKESKEGE
ncbi:MAG: hypothetical protein GY765_29850 [bacterium]|nr:hypothetical protein [bacterium]